MKVKTVLKNVLREFLKFCESKNGGKNEKCFNA
jgi:hypothetical protein